MQPIHRLTIAGLLAVSLWSDATAVDFAREVLPIFKARCFSCHGAKRQKAGLRLDVKDRALAGGDTGRAIIPGKSASSLLVEMITTQVADDRMPPKGEPLTPEQIAIISRWIDAGAVWPDTKAEAPAQQLDHWAFRPPRRPTPTPVKNPVKNSAWLRNPIDRFVLARLEADGLAPSPEADRHTLIRRVSLDLTGLPPSPDDVQCFVGDTSANAYEKVVDRLLAAPAYGERWARMWLDLARYADSNGYASDPLRVIWRYRDWVIEAFNDNLPYDEFTIAQIAGDLLPGARVDHRLATAFHRNTMSNDEGGTNDEEFRVAAVMDRVDTTMQVWMGLTMGCAKCHSHKYDPITQREYYQFFAFFNNTEDADQRGEHPRIKTATREQARQLAALRAELTSLEKPLRYGDRLHPSREERVDDLVKSANSLEGSIPTTPVLRELPAEEKRASRMLIRGNFRNPGDEVQPDVLGVFHPLPESAPKNRLGVALWLVDRANPLTARVAMNRFWAQLFGTGIAETEEDFGTQGTPPSHPALLDWLAIEFMRRGWDMKSMLHLMVTSATYRQSARIAPELLEKDPRNRLLARGPSFRLEAEMLRDQALALGGLLSSRVGGPSVFPPQPPGLWRAAFNSRDRQWPTSDGQDRYRRGLYTFWRRTIPYPSMATFNAPSREICSVRRIRTNTPLQAFVTLNDPVFVEAAQALGRRIVRQGGDTVAERAAFGLELCLVRPADDVAVAALVKLYHGEREHYSAHPKAAKEAATEPLGPTPDGMDTVDLAAWTIVANVLLNLDGVLMKR